VLKSRRVRHAFLHKQWLGDLADEPIRIEQVGVCEADAVVRQMGFGTPGATTRRPGAATSRSWSAGSKTSLVSAKTWTGHSRVGRNQHTVLTGQC
jgi:hypothetical protein